VRVVGVRAVELLDGPPVSRFEYHRWRHRFCAAAATVFFGRGRRGGRGPIHDLLPVHDQQGVVPRRRSHASRPNFPFLPLFLRGGGSTAGGARRLFISCVPSSSCRFPSSASCSVEDIGGGCGTRALRRSYRRSECGGYRTFALALLPVARRCCLCEQAVPPQLVF
jgi:hypothetical protein